MTPCGYAEGSLGDLSRASSPPTPAPFLSFLVLAVRIEPWTIACYSELGTVKWVPENEAMVVRCVCV